MYRSILVPLDGSVFGEHALPYALTIARRAGVPLQVVHVEVPLLAMYAEAAAGFDNVYSPRKQAEARAYLDGVCQRVQAVSPVTVRSALIEGSVPEAIQEHAQETGADLVIMTTHGRGAFSRFWLGSVTDHLVRRAAIPILLVRPTEGEPDLTNERSLPHILIPLDGSVLAEQALAPTLELGKLMGADLTLLRIVEPLALMSPDPLAMNPALIDEQMQEELRDEARIYLERVADALRKQSLRVQTRVVAGYYPASGILEEAGNEVMSLIALATHGRRGLARLVLGSVADKVLRGASVPVLVTRPKPSK